MLEIKYGTETYTFRNTPAEITLGEFDKIFTINYRQGSDNITKFFEVFEFIGVPNEVLDSLNQKEFYEAVKAYNDFIMPTEVVKEFEVNGRKYLSFDGDEFELKARDISLIEQAQLKNDGHFPSWVAAIILKDEQLTNTEHRDWTHIKYKAEQFRKHLTAGDVAPLVARFARRQLNQLSEV